MKTNTRRRFIRNTSLTATGLFLTSVTKAKHESVILNAVACGPNQIFGLLGTIVSTKSGNWSDPSTWGGKLPTDADTPLITSGHTIVYDLEKSDVRGLNISKGATLKFATSKSALLQSSKNIVVEGTLEMTPSNPSITHFIRFINIDESKVIGGGHMVLDTDIGLWVINSGKLNLVGSEKKSWTNLQGGANAGSSSITLKESPTNWAVNDEIVVCPTQSIAELGRPNTVPLFERFNIAGISGGAINLNSSLKYNHDKVEPAGSGKQWTAEILNLSRNVKIEGTPTGKAHIFVKSSVPQTLKFVSLRHMGPKTADIGRYALHFHHCLAGSIGSIVESCVAYEIGSHSFVPHTSDGITFKNCVAFDFLQDAYWWDAGDVTHYTMYDNCVAALGAGTGFFLGMGDENSCINCVAVSAAIGREGGSPNNSGAFFWEANNEGIWEFKNNLSHSNYNGLRVWQNTHKNHVIENYCSYNNMLAAFHGAYMNSYTYKYGYHYRSLFLGKATSSQTSGVRFEHVVFDAGGNEYGSVYSDSPIPTSGENTNKYYYCTFKNFTKAPILFEASKPSETDGTASIARTIKKYDLIFCDLGGKLPEIHPDVENGTVIRIQPVSGKSTKIEKIGTLDYSNGKIVTTEIAPFAAPIWGKGDGLTGEYFNGTIQFEPSKKVVTRIDSIIAFNEWSTSLADDPEMFHHKLNTDSYSVRWSGKLLAQYSEDYVFRCNSAGGVKLTINGQTILDELDAEPFNINDRFALTSSPIKLEAGKAYDIVLEHGNRGGYRGCVLHWQSKSMTHFEIVPQCQLYPSNVVVTPPVVEKTPENIVPVAKAGDDVTITLPTNTVKLNGELSSDGDGKIVSYQWTKQSGPSQFKIENAAIANTSITNLIEGEYVVRLEIKDDKGAIATDEVKITVKPAEQEKQSLSANAGTDATIKLPVNSYKLDGTGSTSTNGSIVSYKWNKISGPSQYSITNAASVSTTLNNLVEGTYVFELLVTDANQNTAKDSVIITVNAEAQNEPPVAIAGDTIELALPENNTTLNGFASTDTDGKIAACKWSKVSGPSKYTIANATALTTAVSDLTEGEYIFRLEVQDDKAAVATDDVKVVVEKQQVVYKAPQVNAGSDMQIALPSNNVKLKGTANVDTTSSIKSYKWTKLSGPSKFKIVNPNSASTVINQLIQGTYVFQLEVVDTNGISGRDEIVITVGVKVAGNDSTSTVVKMQESLTLNVSPNPSTSVFRVNLQSNSDKPITLRLFDRWGKEVGVIKNVKSGSSVTIPGNLNKGTYFGIAEQGFQKKTITLIKM